MKQYLILQYPGHNRVYYNLADRLALSELHLAVERFSVVCTNLDIVLLKGVRYLSFTAEHALSSDDFAILHRLSFVFVLFELKKVEDREMLLPLDRVAYEYLDAKISSLLKYPGKTNELFTKMMINVALLSSNFSFSDPITLLDPVAGRGTTLYAASVYGFSSYGIELDPKSAHESALFFKQYLQTEKIKHKQEKKQVAGSSRSDATYMEHFQYAKNKIEAAQPSTAKKLGLVCGDTKEAARYFKSEQFHLIVGDLPYGIFHGNGGKKTGKSKTRNPSALITDCLAGWKKVLKKGGCIVLAWNSFLVSRMELATLFEQNGYGVLHSAPYDGFEHMVDRSIKRDIIVAKKI
ncbi:MAG: hypothetical protein WCQ82_01170 [Bacteroidaceae bacterium]|nr:hypothetical protein [Bacteroidaceae bacterium]